MEFRLYYRGVLKSNARPDEKHRIRRDFHKQLQVLWSQAPLLDSKEYLLGNVRNTTMDIRQAIGEFQFAPLISQRLYLVADLDILLLRPEPPGAIITQAGDLDNRLKTLLDALKIPKDPNDRPPSISPQAGEDPFFCLLEDDSLITHLSVTSDRLLEQTSSKSEVVLIIRVRTSRSRHMLTNDMF